MKKIKIRFYIGTHKHPLVNVELTGSFEVDAEDVWDTLDDTGKRLYIAERFFEKSNLSWEVEEENVNTEG